MKLQTAIRYQIRTQLISVAIFYAYLCLFAFIFPAIVFLLFENGQVMQSDLTLPTMIYMAICSIIYIRIDFRYLMQMGMSRLNILWSTLTTSILISLVLATVNLFIGRSFSIGNTTYDYSPGMFEHLYVTTNKPKLFALLFVFFLFIAILGMIFGIFFDRFKGLVALLIGGIVLIIPATFLILNQTLVGQSRANFVHFIATATGLHENPNVWAMCVTMMVLNLILFGFVYLLQRHREVKTVD